MMPGGMDPDSLQKMMKQMGIKSDELKAEKVVIHLRDGSQILIYEPQIVQLEMHGQKSFQITGTVREEEGTLEQDIELVVEEAGCTKEEAEAAINECNGDLAEAILKLKKKK